MEQRSTDLTVALAETVSRALDEPIEELPPLSESISLDGVDAVVSHQSSDDVQITFTYAGLRVFIDSGQTIYAEPIHDGLQ